MGLKQHGGFVAGLLAGLLGQHAQLLDCAGLRTLEAVPLGVGILHRVALDLRRGTAVKVKRANADTGGNALALNCDHGEPPSNQNRGCRLAAAAAAVHDAGITDVR